MSPCPACDGMPTAWSWAAAAFLVTMFLQLVTRVPRDTHSVALLTLGLKMLFTSDLAPFRGNLPSLLLLTPQTITVCGRSSTPSLHDHDWLEQHWPHDVKSADSEAVLLPITCVVRFAKVDAAHQLFMGFELRSRGNSNSKVKSIVNWVSRA